MSGKLSQEEIEEGRKKRQQIINDAEAMKRLQKSPDFQRFCEMLLEDRKGLNENLLNENLNNMKNAPQHIRLIARINQIDKVLKKPQSLIWQVKNLTEVRETIKEQTRERQALGNKPGG